MRQTQRPGVVVQVSLVDILAKHLPPPPAGAEPAFAEELLRECEARSAALESAFLGLNDDAPDPETLFSELRRDALAATLGFGDGPREPSREGLA